MYLSDYENKFKSWTRYQELPLGLSFLDDEFEIETYLAERMTFLKGFEATEFARLFFKEMLKLFKDEKFLSIVDQTRSWMLEVHHDQVMNFFRWIGNELFRNYW